MEINFRYSYLLMRNYDSTVKETQSDYYDVVLSPRNRHCLDEFTLYRIIVGFSVQILIFSKMQRFADPYALFVILNI